MSRPSVYYLVFLVAAIMLTMVATASEFETQFGVEDDDDPEQVCVTLEKYGDGCKGHVKATNTFTALTKPGSPCKHTDNMKNNSAKDQYCDARGVFHQKVYIQNKHCKVGWEQKAFSPMKLSYAPDKCTYGYKLKSCTPGACDESPDSNTEDDMTIMMEEDVDAVESAGRLLRGN